MKHFSITLLCMLFLVAGMDAQRLPKSVKKARKALGAGEYKEALAKIDEAMKEDPEAANSSMAWAIKAEAQAAPINSTAEALLKAQLPGSEPVKVGDMSAALDAYASFLTAIEKAEEGDKGKRDKGYKATKKGLVSLESSLNAVTYQLYATQRYEEAFDLFSTMIDLRGTIQEVGGNSIFSKDEDYTLLQYHAGLAAAAGGESEEAMPIYEKLVEMNYNEPLPYEMVFTKLSETDEEAAFAILQKGKENCADKPDKLKGLLYKEINYYSRKGETKKLESRLQDAISQDPENHSLYNVLGSVYSQFAQESYEKGNEEKGDEETAQAVKYYEKVIELKPEISDAHSGIGMMYFNRAAVINQKMIELNDQPYSKENDAKYNKMKEEQGKLFEKAKPYFEKALSLNEKDTTALQGLQSIAAYNNDFEAAKRYKERLEAIRSGE